MAQGAENLASVTENEEKGVSGQDVQHKGSASSSGSKERQPAIAQGVRRGSPRE